MHLGFPTGASEKTQPLIRLHALYRPRQPPMRQPIGRSGGDESVSDGHSGLSTSLIWARPLSLSNLCPTGVSMFDCIFRWTTACSTLWFLTTQYQVILTCPIWDGLQSPPQSSYTINRFCATAYQWTDLLTPIEYLGIPARDGSPSQMYISEFGHLLRVFAIFKHILDFCTERSTSRPNKEVSAYDVDWRDATATTIRMHEAALLVCQNCSCTFPA